MVVRKLSPETINQIVSDQCRKERPRTQSAACAIAARIAVLADDGPWTDEHVINVSAVMARGFFGPAFEIADYAQRSTWIDMCEQELRKAIV
jgi:hypothetical protein